MRVLVAVSPLMYREVIALSLHRHRPDAEVLLCPLEALHEKQEEVVVRFGPHLIVLDDNDGAAPDGLSGIPYRVEILLGAGMDARIGVDGKAREVNDVRMEDLLAVMDEAGKMVLGEEPAG